MVLNCFAVWQASLPWFWKSSPLFIALATERLSFIHLFTQNIDLKPLDWAKLIPDDLHPGRCNSTVILLLSTQWSFGEEVQITESLQEVLECYSAKSMEKATNAIQMFDSKSHDCWVWTFATFSVRTKYSLSPSSSLFFVLSLLSKWKKSINSLNTRVVHNHEITETKISPWRTTEIVHWMKWSKTWEIIVMKTYQGQELIVHLTNTLLLQHQLTHCLHDWTTCSSKPT